MTLREKRRGLLKPSEYRHWPNCHITFIVVKTSLIYSLFTLLRYIWGGGRRGLGWLKTSFGGGGWLKTSEYRHMGRGV